MGITVCYSESLRRGFPSDLRRQKSTEDKMKSAFIWIVFLACVSVGLSAPAILDCRCLTLNKNVRFEYIDNVLELEPRPYCSRKEVIVKLKDGTSRCLDPKEKFTKAVLLTKRLQDVRNAMKKNASLRSTIAPTTVQASTLNSR
ncbi:C-X-C motif chemokine 2-like [Halichoeres trimaculatus]|uniref:C-X-C motif chemokine 2-like n=1 Tax=Halichoeres trimaculatus TaxID=147232 RepID=UPI003D9E8305